MNYSKSIITLTAFTVASIWAVCQQPIPSVSDDRTQLVFSIGTNKLSYTRANLNARMEALTNHLSRTEIQFQWVKAQHDNLQSEISQTKTSIAETSVLLISAQLVNLKDQASTNATPVSPPKTNDVAIKQ